MIRPLLQFRDRLTNHERDALDNSRILTSVVRGFVQTINVPPSSNPLRRSRPVSRSSTITLISRLSSRRMGTRFNSRGIDDEGNVANFVETETLFWSPSGLCFSYTQIRGSVPIFWESSTSLLPGQQKIQITRSPEATQPAFDKHFEMLERTYGAVHIVNLLTGTKTGELELTERYRYHIQHSPLRQTMRIERGEAETSEHHLLQSTEFDLHERAKSAGSYEGAKAIRQYLESSAESFVYFLTEEVDEQLDVKKTAVKRKIPVIIMQQAGVFRVNCLDCLDRTNVTQTLISQMGLEIFLSHRAETANADFWMRHSTLWADNGDALSKIYAGTGALKSSFTRHGKMSLAGAIADARKSATRLYVNNFVDKGRQNTTDLLLGRLVGQAPVQLFDPINDYVVEQLNSRKYVSEYTSCEPIYVWCGTMNLNGKIDGLKEDLSPWLYAKSKGFAFDYDVVCVGFQEVVELSPQQIMSTDPSVRILWEKKVKESLNANPGAMRSEKSGDEYVLLRSGQLVGAALMVFVKSKILGNIRNVEGAIKKTGLSGMAGNKGAVAVRMDIQNTSLCVVTAHLAAGFANDEERNRDYRTIAQGIRFVGGRGIEDHDAVIWLGDFNYRIGLGHEEAMGLVEQLQNPQAGPKAEEALEKLYENDQLNIQMVAGQVFPWYQEMRVNFLPTYKFDVGTDKYDSSEKARIPAWCDRVIYKSNTKSGQDGGRCLKGLEYGSVQELRFSDHRPVYATFELDVAVVDEAKKSQLAKSVEQKRRADVEGILLREKSEGTTGDDDDDDTASDSADAEDLIGYESIAEGLPPASSDRRKWWLDGDKPVRSTVGPPRPGMVLNERRPGNPWRYVNGRGGAEEDWIEVPAAESGGANGRGSGQRSASEGGSWAGSPKPKTPPPVPAPRGARRMGLPTSEGEKLARQASERVKEAHKTRRDVPPQAPGAMDGESNGNFGDAVRPGSNAPASQTLPQETSRPNSVTSRRNSVTGERKPPPYKPEKPVALRSTSHIHGSGPASSQLPMRAEETPGSTKSMETPPSLPSRSTTISSEASGRKYFDAIESREPSATTKRAMPPTPVQPYRVRSAQSSDHDAGISKTTMASADEEARPPLPPRRVPTNHGLMDDGGSEGFEIGEWRPLIPK